MPADDAPDPAPADPPSTPTDPAQAAEHSPSEPDSPPASDLADAPRPRRRGPDPARRRAASTGFLLGSLAALLVTAVLAVVWYRQMPFTTLPEVNIRVIVYGAIGGLVLLNVLVAAAGRSRVFARFVSAIALLGASIPAARALRSWWGIYLQTTIPPRHLTALAAACLAAGLLAACAFHTVSVRSRRRTERPARSVARGAAPGSGPAAVRLLRRFSRRLPAPRALAVGAVGFLVPVLACTALAVLPSALVRPAISTTAPVPRG